MLGTVLKCIDEHCEWMVYATNEVHDSKNYFLVKTLNERHTCSKVFQISHVKSPWIAEHYEAMIYAHPGIKPTYILDTIKAQVEIKVTRNQCKRAKALVMKRLERDVLNEYKKLNDYAKALVDTNPDIEVEHIGTGIPPYFKSMYVCLAAVCEGFLDSYRKYLGLDGCFLKGVVKGMLLTAVGKDANNQMFPLAWGIVETESQSSWTWFLEHLKVDIKTKDGGEWTFMSDKQKHVVNERSNGMVPMSFKFIMEELNIVFILGIRPVAVGLSNFLEKFIAAYNHPIKVVGSEEFWPSSGRGELSPPLPKPMPGRPKKARSRRKYEPKKSKTKLSRHGRDMHCENCDSNTHNSKTCSLYDGASTSHDASVPRNGTGC
nr:hypothetical protein [Tanacetum cinerariifolium]